MTAIAYGLTVEGSPLPAAALAKLTRVEMEEHVELADVLRLTFGLSPRENASGWTVLDDDLFPRLARIRLTVTVGSGSSQPIMEGYVVESAATFDNDPAANVFSVIAFDASVLMNLEERVRAWAGMADSDIATAIFGEYGFATQVDATQPARNENAVTVIQRATDIQFLRQLARRNGFDCYVELDPASGQPTGHFHAPRVDDAPQGVLAVGMGQESTVDKVEFHFDMLRPAHAVAANLDAAASDDQSAEVVSPAIGLMGSRSTLGDDRPRKVRVNPTLLTDAGELQSYAQAVVDRAAFALTAEGELNTQSYGGVLRAKRPVLVRGVGSNLSGVYMVERVLHIFEGGSHKQSFTLRRNALGVAGQEDFTVENS
jgi:phage protein D